MSTERPVDRIRSVPTRAASGAWQAVLAAVRPQPTSWNPPWARFSRAGPAPPRAAGGAGRGGRPAVRPRPPSWNPPWARFSRAGAVASVVFGLYGLIVAIAASGAVLNDRGGVPGGLSFLYLLPLVAG